MTCRFVCSELRALFRPRWIERGKFSTFRWHLSRHHFIEGNRMRLTNEQEVTFSIAAKTAAGNPAPLDGPASVTSSDEAVAVVVMNEDGVSGVVRAVGPGVAQIFATADADLGDGVRPLEFSGAIEVVQAEAEVAEFTFGEPTLKTA